MPKKISPTTKITNKKLNLKKKQKKKKQQQHNTQNKQSGPLKSFKQK